MRELGPHCVVKFRHGDDDVLLMPEAQPSLLAAWQAGQAFWSGETLWGNRVVIRLGEVVAVFVNSAEGIAAYLADDAERKLRDLTDP